MAGAAHRMWPPLAAAILAAAFTMPVSAASPETATGKIKGYECGDNCYLTIKTAKGETTGLCEAKACTPWFENQKMPRAMIGKKVKVRLASGAERTWPADRPTTWEKQGTPGDIEEFEVVE